MHVIDLAGSSSHRSNSNDPTASTITNANVIQHAQPILQVALDQCGAAAKRQLAVLDKSKDLYLMSVRGSNKTTFAKLGRKIESFSWSATNNILAAVQDRQLVVWYCPTAAVFNSSPLLKLCSMHDDSPELGRSPRIQDFIGNSSIALRRVDGSLINVPISPYPTLLHK